MTVTNTDGDDSAEEVKVSLASVVKEPLHMSLVNEHGLGEVGQEGGIQAVTPHLTHMVVVWTLGGGGTVFIVWPMTTFPSRTPFTEHLA